MSADRILTRLRRAMEFSRHMPLRKLARRFELDVRRGLRDRLPVAPRAATPPARASRPPLPLFRPRDNFCSGADGVASARFLGREWPLGGGPIDWTQPGDGPTRHLARMNLHYMEYIEAADDATFADFTTQWIGANPRDKAGAWRDSWNSYALSIRVVVWLQQLARRQGRIASVTVERIESSAVLQMRFLEHNLETDIGGNHLVKNIKALIWASAYFSGADATRWRAKGLALLSRELDRQVLPDGMHYERSPSYHCQVFADLLECRHALGSDPLGGRLHAALSSMAQATADLAHPDGTVALFNDAGLAMSFAPDVCLDVYARLLGQRPTTRTVFALADAGYFGFRTAGIYLVIDCGRIAPDDLPAHGHGDILSFEISVGGERIVVDQGVYEYCPGEQRQASRAAASHNTLCVDGGDQADFFGSFRCGRRPNVDIRIWQPRVDGFVFEGSHDGFANLPGAPIHVRRFDVAPGRIEITDRIEGQMTRGARIGFLLHPDVETTIDDGRAVLRRGRAHVVVGTSHRLSIADAVWWPDMGVTRPTRRLFIDIVPGQREVVTRLDFA